MKMNSRRTLMYFHIESDDIVRAPQTRMSRPSGRKSRMTLTPRGLRMSCSRLLSVCDERLAAAVQIAADDAAHHFVGRRLVHAALDVDARVDAGDVAGGRDELVPVRRVRRDDAHPRVVERAVGAVPRRPDLRDSRRCGSCSLRIANRSFIASHGPADRSQAG